MAITFAQSNIKSFYAWSMTTTYLLMTLIKVMVFLVCDGIFLEYILVPMNK